MIPGDDIKQILEDHPYYIFNMENPSDELISIALESTREQYLHVMINLIPNVNQDKFLDVLSNRKMMMLLVKNKSPKLQCLMVSQFPETIFVIDNPCEEAQIVVARKKPELIRYLKNPCRRARYISCMKMIFSMYIEYVFLLLNVILTLFSPIDQLGFIRKYPNYIRKIQAPTNEEQLAAVQLNPYCIAYIENPSDKVQKYMFKNHLSICLCMMQNISPSMQDKYVSTNPLWIAYIKNPLPNVELKVLIKCPELIYYIKTQQTLKRLDLLRKNPAFIALLPNPTFKEEFFVLKRGLSFYDFVKPTNAILKYIIRLKPYMILHIINPSPDILSYAVSIDSNLSILLDTAPEKDQLEIIQKNPWMIWYIANPSESIQMNVFRQNPKCALFIKNPLQSVQDCAVQHNPSYKNFFENPDSEESQKFLYNTLFKKFLPADYICAICRAEENEDTPNCRFSRKIRCGHLFHADCIRPWINTNPSCPMCRAPVI